MIEKIPEFMMIGPKKIKFREKGEYGKPGKILETLPKDIDGDVMAATFEAPNNLGLTILLKAKEDIYNPSTKQHESVPDSEIRIVFKGGKWRTPNKDLMMMVMANSEYKKMFSIDGEDPTYLWRAIGAIKVEMRPVIARAEVSPPNVEDMKSMKATPPKEEEKVEKIRVIG